MFPKVNVPGEGYIGSESSPTTPSILQLLLFFRLLLILLFQMSVHMTTLEDNGQPLQGGNQLMIKILERRNQRINVEHK